MSPWTKVNSGISQGSVLGPLLFVIYINNLLSLMNSDMYLFADDTKIFWIVSQNSDIPDLQNDLDKMADWSDR